MTRYLPIVFLCVLVLGSFIACRSTPSVQKVEARDADIEPGKTVKLLGSNFGKDPAKLEVTVEGKEAEVTRAEDTSLEITIPRNVDAGSHKLVVKNRETNEQSSPVEVNVVEHVRIPVETTLDLQTMEALGSEASHSGDEVSMVFSVPLVSNGRVVAAAGSHATGRVTFVDQPGKVKGRAAIGFTVETISLETGAAIPVQTNDFNSRAPSGKKKDATEIAITTGVGTLIGALVGGGKGAAIGAATGAGAGSAIVLTTRGNHVLIPKGSRVEFVLQKPIEIEIHKPLPTVAQTKTEKQR